MKIPKTLKIGGHTIKVISGKLSGDTCGESDFHKGTITIDSRMPHSLQESTLIHEILHFCNSTLGETNLGHTVIDSLSEQLYQVLSSNKLIK